MEFDEKEIALSDPVFFVNENIIYVLNTELSKWPNVISALTAIGQECHSTFNPCQFYPNCKSYVVMYAENIDKIMVQSLADINTSWIKAYTVAIVFDELDATELWDVCSSKSSRGKGYASKILESITRLSSKSRIWLGVLFWNEQFDQVVKLYAKFGFGNPDFTNRSLANHTFAFSFLSLYWQRGIQSPNINDVIAGAKRLKDAYNGLMGKCSIRLRIESSLLLTMYKVYSTQSIEFGGKMRIFEYVDTGVSYRAARVGFAPQLEVQGSKEQYTVNVPIAPINFHTHPDICYATLGCYLGWPSAGDMAYILSNYEKGLRLHLLVAKEGVYFITLETSFAKDWINAPEWFKQGLTQSVYQFFGSIESHRVGKTEDVSGAEYNLTAFLEGVNKFNVDNALDYVKSQGHDVSGISRNSSTALPIFQVRYLNWIDVERTPIIEFDFLYLSWSGSTGAHNWPNKCDVFEKAEAGVDLAYSGDELIKLAEKYNK